MRGGPRRGWLSPAEPWCGRGLSHHPFGFFVDLGGSALGLVEITQVKDPDQAVSPADYPAVGMEITAVVLAAVDIQRQVHLSIRPSDLASGPAGRGLRR